MSEKLPKEYWNLMRVAINEDGSASPPTQRPLKRRKRNNQKTENKDLDFNNREISTEKESKDTTNNANFSKELQQDSDTVHDPKSKKAHQHLITEISLGSDQNNSTHDSGDNDESDQDEEILLDGTRDVDDSNHLVDDNSESDSDDEFEDVDLDNVETKASRNLTSDVVINFESSTEKQKKKPRNNVVNKEERVFRRTYHRNYIAIMAIHGVVRNKWCNNIVIQTHLRRKLVTPAIFEQLHPPKSIDKARIRTRRFLDGLRSLLENWSTYYKVTSNKGLFKHDWYDWHQSERSKTDFNRFSRCLMKGRGTRDIGAQGFVALLRAAGVPSRLVFSLQPPDFTSLKIKDREHSSQVESVRTEISAHSIKDRVVSLRKEGAFSFSPPTQAEIEMKYPVFWSEAWDSASKTWITIDPIMFKIIENVKNKSELEPPSSDPYNNITYVLGYDRRGNVRDVTKRYAAKYYARTRKKRITKLEGEETWYTGFLQYLSTDDSSKTDKYEESYFSKKAEQEGMPDSIQDFKGHPLYALEMHLRSNEILHPQVSCGSVRIKGKNEAIPVFRRSNVYSLKSPRAWYQHGRVLKAGERPLKTKPPTGRDPDSSDEERLYAEFQTEIYVPPPIVDGLITKNAYGNLDVYVPSMVPKGGVLIETPHAKEAAELLGIDFAPAVVGFKFERRKAVPRISGIVVGEDFEDAIKSAQEFLENQYIEKQKKELELRALNAWALLLTKLRISNRLDKKHGKVQESNLNDLYKEDFVPIDMELVENSTDQAESDDEPTILAGGFIPDEYETDLNSNNEDSESEDYEEYSERVVEREKLVDPRVEFVYDKKTGFALNENGQFIRRSKETDSPEVTEKSLSLTNHSEYKEGSVDDSIHDAQNLDEFEAFFEQLQENDKSVLVDDTPIENKEIAFKQKSHEQSQNRHNDLVVHDEAFDNETSLSSARSLESNGAEGLATQRVHSHKTSTRNSPSQEVQYIEPDITEPQFDQQLESDFNEQLEKENSISPIQDETDNSEYDDFEYDSE